MFNNRVLLIMLVIFLFFKIFYADSKEYEFITNEKALSIIGGCTYGCEEIIPSCDLGCTKLKVHQCSTVTTTCVDNTEYMSCYCGPGHYVFVPGCPY